MSVMGDKVPYPQMSSNDMMDYLIERLLYRFRDSAKNPEMAKRFELAYKQRFKANMMPEGSVYVENVCLHGTPGVGKTSVVRAAAKEIAKMTGMKFVLDPVPPYRPDPNDLLVTTLEMSGEISNIIIGGIPIADQLGTNSPVKYMNKLPLYQLAIIPEATASVLLLDDFANAAPMVQNSALSIALEGRFQMMSLGNAYVALTANLGALDNSDVSPLSDPMTARIGHFYVEDTVPDFVDRINAKHTDSIGDAGICSFLMQDRSLFLLPTDSEHRSSVNGLRTPFPCPRTWEKLINELRVYRNRINGSGLVTAALQAAGSTDALEEVAKSGFSLGHIIKLSEAYVGKHAATKVANYVYAMMTGAEPIVKEAIRDGKFNEDLFKNRYNDGIDSASQDFGYQVAFCLSAHASSFISEEKGNNLDEVIGRFGKVLANLDAPTRCLAMSDFGSRLKLAMPEWAVKDSTGKPLYIDGDYTSKICKVIYENGRYTKQEAQDISHAFVNANRRDSYSSKKTERPGRIAP
ncbi:AAA family ATPase [Methylobacillus sp. Pita2]|uniref:AAA family ATPase n=1 Tax=Methylobacillus sp. Pita2 TaxID=3383245 RepID=UPI0038B4F432